MGAEVGFPVFTPDIDSVVPSEPLSGRWSSPTGGVGVSVVALSSFTNTDQEVGLTSYGLGMEKKSQ